MNTTLAEHGKAILVPEHGKAILAHRTTR